MQFVHRAPLFPYSLIIPCPRGGVRGGVTLPIVWSLGVKDQLENLLGRVGGEELFPVKSRSLGEVESHGFAEGEDPRREGAGDLTLFIDHEGDSVGETVGDGTIEGVAVVVRIRGVVVVSRVMVAVEGSAQSVEKDIHIGSISVVFISKGFHSP